MTLKTFERNLIKIIGQGSLTLEELKYVYRKTYGPIAYIGRLIYPGFSSAIDYLLHRKYISTEISARLIDAYEYIDKPLISNIAFYRLTIKGLNCINYDG